MLIIARVKSMTAQQMSSEAVGVQRIIKNNSSEKTVYTHYCGHNVALNICTACKLVIRNALDTVKDTCMMFVRGSKKMSYYVMSLKIIHIFRNIRNQFLISVSLDGSKTSMVTKCF